MPRLGPIQNPPRNFTEADGRRIRLRTRQEDTQNMLTMSQRRIFEVTRAMETLGMKEAADTIRKEVISITETADDLLDSWVDQEEDAIIEMTKREAIDAVRTKNNGS